MSIENEIKKTTTISDLIDQLESLKAEYGDDMPVFFSYNYGDYWKTQVCAPISNITESFVNYSDNHNMLKIDDEDEEDEENRTLVLTIE
jgi:hypothetical protein